jgi:hypothetical protein
VRERERRAQPTSKRGGDRDKVVSGFFCSIKSVEKKPEEKIVTALVRFYYSSFPQTRDWSFLNRIPNSGIGIAFQSIDTISVQNKKTPHKTLDTLL